MNVRERKFYSLEAASVFAVFLTTLGLINSTAETEHMGSRPVEWTVFWGES